MLITTHRLFSQVDSFGVRLQGDLLSCDDLYLVRRALETRLDTDYDGSFGRKVAESLKAFIADPAHLRLTLLQLECPSNHVGDSLCRLLLGLEQLQRPLAAVLLERVPGLTDAEVEEGLHRLVLGQLKWLDFADPASSWAIAELMLAAHGACRGQMLQRDILMSLPEVVSEPDHANLFSRLVGPVEGAAEHEEDDAGEWAHATARSLAPTTAPCSHRRIPQINRHS